LAEKRIQPASVDDPQFGAVMTLDLVMNFSQ